MGSWLLLARKICRNPIMIVGRANVPPALGMRMVLAPILALINNGSSASVDITVGEDKGMVNPFVSYYGVAAENYLTDNEVAVKLDSHITDGTPETPKQMFVVPEVMGNNVRWAFLPLALGATHWLWYAPGGIHPTVNFEDVNGNEAYMSPVMRFTFGSPNEVLFFSPIIDVEVVESDGFSVVLRLTRRHIWEVDVSHSVDPDPEGTYLNGGSINYTWNFEAVGGAADPHHPTDVDITLVTVTRGVHVFGVTADYVDGSSAAFNFIGKYSCVVEVF